MLLIFTLFIFPFIQQISFIQAHDGKYGLDDEQPEKFYVTHEAWFNITVKENKVSPVPITTGRIVIALFGEICPMTVTNFITITKGLRRSSVNNEKLNFNNIV